MGLLAKLTGKSASAKTTSKASSAASKHRGVAVKPGPSQCCQAVKAIAGRRYLSHQAPRLPLDDCDVANCGCTYQQFEDRRTDSRRASDIGYDIASQLLNADDRRSHSRGRRDSDD